jgi:hypothetical protein
MTSVYTIGRIGTRGQTHVFVTSSLRGRDSESINSGLADVLVDTPSVGSTIFRGRWDGGVRGGVAWVAACLCARRLEIARWSTGLALGMGCGCEP